MHKEKFNFWEFLMKPCFFILILTELGALRIISWYTHYETDAQTPYGALLCLISLNKIVLSLE